MALTLGQAAEAAKRSKTTISRAIASGRLSAARDPAGNWAIEPVELFRAFPPAMPQEQAPERPREPLPQPSAATAMEQLVQELRARLADKDGCPSSSSASSWPCPHRAAGDGGRAAESIP
jgi:hypothetical protein